MPTCINADTQYVPVNSDCSVCDMPQVATQEPQNSAFLGGNNAAKIKSLEAILLEIQQLLRESVTKMSILSTEAANLETLQQIKNLTDSLKERLGAIQDTLIGAVVSSSLKIAGGLVGIGGGYGTGIGATWGTAVNSAPPVCEGIGGVVNGNFNQDAAKEQMKADVLEKSQNLLGEAAAKQLQELRNTINELMQKVVELGSLLKQLQQASTGH